VRFFGGTEECFSTFTKTIAKSFLVPDDYQPVRLVKKRGLGHCIVSFYSHSILFLIHVVFAERTIYKIMGKPSSHRLLSRSGFILALKFERNVKKVKFHHLFASLPDWTQHIDNENNSLLSRRVVATGAVGNDFIHSSQPLNNRQMLWHDLDSSTISRRMIHLISAQQNIVGPYVVSVNGVLWCITDYALRQRPWRA
jgi:hypothetical protein